jgi:hypothetical protein
MLSTEAMDIHYYYRGWTIRTTAYPAEVNVATAFAILCLPLTMLHKPEQDIAKR